jgi:hypothetical protein
MNRVFLAAAALLLAAACGADKMDPAQIIDSGVAANPDATVFPDATAPDAAVEEDAGVEESDAGEMDASEPAAPTWSQVQAVFNSRCAGCHDGRQGRWDATDHTDLINVRSDDVPLDRVEPGSAEMSFLFLKVTSAQRSVCDANALPPMDCGSRMPPPPNNAMLTQTQKNLIEEWIVAGALVD